MVYDALSVKGGGSPSSLTLQLFEIILKLNIKIISSIFQIKKPA